jgi:hypothetical protein
MKNNKSTDDIQLDFNFSNEFINSSEMSNKNNNIVSLSELQNNKNRNEKFKEIERIVSLSNHLYK